MLFSALPARDPTYPPAPRPAVGLPRRRVLGGLVATAAAAAVVGCRRTAGPATSAPNATPTRPDPLLADLATERQLLSAYDATLRAYPGLATRLRPLRANHAQHVTALRQAIAAAAPASTTGAEGPPAAAPPATATTQPAPRTATATAALSVLRTREHAASMALAASAVRARGERAALLASIAACSASHEVLLS